MQINTIFINQRRKSDKGRSIAPVFFITLILIIFVTILEEKEILKYLSFFYLIQLLVILHAVYKRQGGVQGLLRPSVVGLTYSNISYIVGASAFYTGVISVSDMSAGYNNWKDVDLIVIFFLLANCLVGVAPLLVGGAENVIGKARQESSTKLKLYLYRFIVLTMIIGSSFIDNDYISIFRTVLSIAIFHSFFIKKSRFRWLVVFLCIGFIATLSFDSKRNAIFLVLPAIWMEISFYRVRNFSAKLVGLAIIAIGLLVYLILAMSIMRGYGSLDAKSFVDALILVPVYVANPNIWSYLLNNFEFSTVFFSSHNAVAMINYNQILVSYGESFLKALFIGIPVDLFGYKPKSILDLYTKAWAPDFRAIGGSYPITIFSEMYWNFYWFGLIPLFLLFFYIEKMYVKYSQIVENSGLVFSVIFLTYYFYSLYFIRGSGIDIILVYLIIATGIAYFVLAPIKYVLNIDANKIK